MRRVVRSRDTGIFSHTPRSADASRQGKGSRMTWPPCVTVSHLRSPSVPHSVTTLAQRAAEPQAKAPARSGVGGEAATQRLRERQSLTTEWPLHPSLSFISFTTSDERSEETRGGGAGLVTSRHSSLWSLAPFVTRSAPGTGSLRFPSFTRPFPTFTLIPFTLFTPFPFRREWTVREWQRNGGRSGYCERSPKGWDEPTVRRSDTATISASLLVPLIGHSYHRLPTGGAA